MLRLGSEEWGAVTSHPDKFEVANLPLYSEICDLIQPCVYHDIAQGFFEDTAGRMEGNTRSRFFEEFARASRTVDTAPDTLPACAVPSNLLIYAFMAYVLPSLGPSLGPSLRGTAPGHAWQRPANETLFQPPSPLVTIERTTRSEIRKRYDAQEVEKTCEEESGSQGRRPSSFALNLHTAMDSVIRHPTEIDGVDSLLSVNGVGPRIAELVMDAMFDTSTARQRDGGKTRGVAGAAGAGTSQRRVEPVRSKEYVPRLGSANYAFLIVLYRAQHGENGRPHLTKTELMDLAEASGLSSKPIHCRGGGSARLRGSQASRTYYNGWSNFKALLNNGLVSAWGSPRKIALTEAGVAVARRLAALISPADESISIVPSQNLADDVMDALDCPAPARRPNRQVVCNVADRGIGTADGPRQDADVEVVLLIDSREQYARSIAEQMPGVEVRLLPIGDALWVARRRRAGAGSNAAATTGSGAAIAMEGEEGVEAEEYVLDYIIERKSIQDLLHSVREGSRYHSQKYRLQQCGLRHLYYLVEGDVESLSSSSDYKVVGTACAKTSAIDGFNVLRPKSFAETLAMLTRMTRSIRKRMRDAHFDGSRARSMGMMTFAEFQDRCVRLERDADCVRDVWSVMLNEVPGIGRVAVERDILSDPRHRTCHGFHESEVRRADRDVSSSSKKGKVDRVWATLFFDSHA